MTTVRVSGPLTRLARRHGSTRSPLRRSADRVEAGVTAALAVLALLTVLLATVAAMNTYHRVQTEAATKATQRSSVVVVLLTNRPCRSRTHPSRLSQAKRPPWRAGHYRTGNNAPHTCGSVPTAMPETGYRSDRSARQPRRPTGDILVHDR